MKTLFLNTSFFLAITASCFAGGAGQSIGSFSDYATIFNDDGYSQIDLTNLDLTPEFPSATADLSLDWVWSDVDYIGDIEYSESTAENNEILLGVELVTGENYYDSGLLPNSVGADYGPPLIGDPVNPVTGDFYVDTVDLALRGPMPLEIRRNYFSRKGGIGAYGYGWKRSLLPYLAAAGSIRQRRFQAQRGRDGRHGANLSQAGSLRSGFVDRFDGVRLG